MPAGETSLPLAQDSGSRRLSSHLFIAVLLAVHLVICLTILSKNASHPKTSDRLVSSDSVHYVDIANDFAQGNFSMGYVRERPHRQPLYPALLAVAAKIGNGDRFFLGTVNVLLASASILAIYILVSKLNESAIAAGVAAVALAANPFIDRLITARLLTEPTHLLMTIFAIYCFLRYLRDRKRGWLFACSFWVGMDYLARPNGLFMAVTALGTLGLADLLNFRESIGRGTPISRWLGGFVGSYLLAGVIFFAVASPSWVPRLVYFGEPFHHGYLENFMWVDTYAAGHVGESYPTYTWRDYIGHHGLYDVLGRIWHGLRNVYFRIPITMERAPILYLLALGGVYVTFRKSLKEYSFLLLFLFLQLAPLVWTNLANPTARVPYGSTLPFELFLAGLFVAAFLKIPWVRSRFAS
jgi:Dolichyl-phosphate-mannose-protein mannosyltransferase